MKQPSRLNVALKIHNKQQSNKQTNKQELRGYYNMYTNNKNLTDKYSNISINKVLVGSFDQMSSWYTTMIFVMLWLC